MAENLGSIEDILSQVSSYKAGVNDAMGKLNKIYQSSQEVAGSMAIANTNDAKDLSTVEAVKQAADLRTQARISKAADIFGTDVLAQGNQIQELAAQSQEAFDHKMQVANTIAEKKSVGITDDPLQYIMNRFTLNSDIAEHNAANAQWQNLQARITELNQNTQGTIQTQKQLETGVDETSALAASRLAGSKARMAAMNAELQAYKFGAEGIAAVLNAGKDSLQASQTAYSSINAEKQIQIAQSQLQLARENAQERKREFDERMAEKQDERAQGEYMVDSINKGRAARGLLPLDPLEGKMAARGLMGKGGGVKTEWQDDYLAGQRIDAGVKGSIAGNPADLIRRQSSGVPLNLTPQQKPILDLAEKAMQVIKRAQDPSSAESKLYPDLVGLVERKDPEAIKAAIGRISQNLVLAQSKNVNFEDKSNIFNIPNLKTIAANQPVVAELPVYQKVLKPVLDHGIDLSDPKKVFNLVGDAFANGTLTYKEAIEATTIYHVGVGINAAQRNTMGVAGMAMPMQYNAEVEINPNGLIGKKAVINLANPDQFGRALIQSQSHRLGQQLLGVTKDIPMFSESQVGSDLLSGVKGITAKVPTLIQDKSNTPNFVPDTRDIPTKFFDYTTKGVK